MPLALYALAIGGFGIGLTEFGILGLLPEVATDFGVSETTAGYLISGYALSVALGAVLLTAALLRFDQKKALLGLMILFIAGNLVSALATDYSMMLVGRILAALCHGAFFGIGTVVATGLVTAERKAAAIATMFAGLTIANVAGVPLGTLLGQAAGWRSTFWAITIIGIVSFISIMILVPNTSHSGEKPAPGVLRREIAAFTNPQVWYSIVLTILGFGGMFGAFTYIAFTLTDVSGFVTGAVPWLLIVFGAGMVIGNIISGKLTDRFPARTLLASFIGLTIVLALFAAFAQSPIITIAALFLMGGFGFGTVPPLQMRIMSHAAAAPTLASGANVAAFNIGNAVGAWLGGLTIGAGLGYTSPLWVGAAMTLGALVVLLIAGRLRGGEFTRARARAAEPSAAAV
ncbi:DHA1 family inner membrane transport protein [Mycetocola sp. BIGb0189]|uniref:MFS transporter n=1 Tax=Mycetocola sp. BIGb0189 TaxID=2940604 RepID=UPI0021684940|nr:MFS transporter [Mycetocola sp. BIGb0189]MCS4274876.1 DHA1 family inner membrane transport protein [Mycetocola sp. BIGb0189]